MIVVAVLILVASYLIFYYVKLYNNVWRYSEKFPGKTTLPIVGNAHQMGNTSYDYLQKLFAWTKEYNFTAFRTWLGPQLFVIITDPKDCEIVLNNSNTLEKFNDYRFLHDWIGDGLITKTGQKWFQQRRLITPSFHFKILNDFHPIMNKGLNNLISKLDTFAESGKSFDIQHISNLATLDVICETAMGVEVNALNDPESELVGAFHDVSYVVYQRIFSSWKRFDWLFPLSEDYRINQRALKILHSFNDDVIQKRKIYLKELSESKETSNNIDSEEKKKQLFIDSMLTAKTADGKSLTDQEISDEVSTFIFAGHDTTSAGISFALYHLAIHPEEQKKVYEEQLSIFDGEMDRDSTQQDMQQMKQLELFIKESQRVIPPVAFIGRQAKGQVELSQGQIVPEGASIGILLFAMGHNPKTFENPEHFDSDRFLADARSHKNPYEYIPFSTGSRNCIGQKFALLEIRTVLAKIVRRYEILPQPNFEVMLGATATTVSANGVYIKLKRRSYE